MRPNLISCHLSVREHKKENVDNIIGQCPPIVTSLKCSCAGCRDGMVLIAATTADTDCAYYFALAF